MTAYVIFEVEIRDADRWKDFPAQLKPLLAAAGAKYLVRGGVSKIHEDDWSPRSPVSWSFRQGYRLKASTTAFTIRRSSHLGANLARPGTSA